MDGRSGRGRTRRSGTGRAIVRVGASNAGLLAGDDNIREWDDEELLRGQRRDRNGRFTGAPPKVVPKAVHDELVRRTMGKAGDLLRVNLLAATEVLISIAADETVEPSVRLKAVGMIQDR